jgi:riboflavin biosynthesis pyrimidine reductase
MRQLFPEPVDDVDPEAVHATLRREPPEDRPYVLVNMIESVDGAAVVDGVSGGLGGEGDKIMFRAVRAVPDIILVAAPTANAESYSTPRVGEEARAARRDRGQSSTPRLAVVTGQLSVDLSLGMFTDPGDQRPLVITAEAAPTNRRDEVEAVAEVLVAGESTVDLTDALRQLRRRGAGVVLCEGGPSMNGGLVGLDLVDEWCISLSPVLAGGDSRRIVNTAPPALRPLTLERIFEHDGMLFLRYVRGAA